MPKKRYWKGASFSDRKQHEQRRLERERKKAIKNQKSTHEEQRKLLHEPQKLMEYIKRMPHGIRSNTSRYLNSTRPK